MAQKRTNARLAPSAARQQRNRTAASRGMSVPRIRWLAARSRPRSLPELITLCLTILGIATVLVDLTAALRRGHASTVGLAWGALLLCAAALARTFHVWRGELVSMTRARLRAYGGVALLVVAATSISGHVVLATLGWTSGYPLLGPASAQPWAFLILALAALIGLALISGFPVGHIISATFGTLAASIVAARRRETVRTDFVDEPKLSHEAETVDASPLLASDLAPTRPTRGRSRPAGDPAPEAVSPAPPGATPLPPIETFKVAPKGLNVPVDLEHKAKRIEETLSSFNVKARVVAHHSGPVVTQFDIQPDVGVKVKSIVGLQNDLALALAAPTIRIQAPVPGKPVVGIEIPNSAASVVALRDLLESDAYRTTKSTLGVMLGKDVAGGPALIDLAKMPHLLIAGATGSGKSVCVNAIISCLLYRNPPEQVRLLMVDPKMVELTVYNGVPHLLSPVVTQMDKVVGVLQWTLREMERRYQLFADSAVRNIQRYNETADQRGVKSLPYVVVIIDELADLMMISPEEVEEAICRLAQLARAAGIHLIIATQRPSVDVVTGLIKANFPARIAFMMTSQVDSRTILDRAGAEKLLGRGDMLYQPPDGPAPVRLQGAHVSDQEIERLVEFWKRSPLHAGIEAVPEEEFAAAEKAAGEADDDLLQEATDVVRKFRTASVTLLQRHLRIGYARAARLMDCLEERGIVGPADGSKQRPVLDADQE
jgi:S-DNA-T family DNA segregation ATPase FtsK/SpoIIIE